MVTASFFAAVLFLLPAGFAWALTTPPCAPSGVTHVISLVVEDTSGALQLTQALSCSSEGVSSFIEVKWVGSVIVNETLHVSHGTILDVKGTADGSSILDGAGQNALFKVFDNSTLRLSGVTLTNAASNYSDDGRDAEREVGRGGAAVMAVDSAVVSAGCIFSNNIHVAGRGYGDEGGGGGAVYLLNSTFDAVGPDVTKLVNNVAVLGDGGAIFADGESRVNVIGGGSIHFSGNSAPDGRGGAVSTGNSSVSVYSGGEVIFASNTAGDEGGGALWIGAGSSVRFLSHSRASFFNNSAIDGAGGAILLSGDGEIVLAGDTVLDSNTANQGGAIGMLRGTSASVTGNVSMSHNNATLSGGAMHCEAPALLAINGGTKFASNSVEKGSGGAITTFSAGTQGAPVVLINCTFLFNTAAGDGGALAILGGFIDIERSYFEANTAGAYGGAVRASGFVSVRDTEFYSNRAIAGPAVSNSVRIAFSAVTFTLNLLSCAAGTMLEITADVATDSAEYEVECDSCPDLCSDCWVHDNHVHTCEPVPAHTNSPAAGGTLYSLQLDRGYWRYSVTSKEILRCYEAGACIGGIAAIGDTRADEDAYCGEGYTGPCYAPGLGHACSKCSVWRRYVVTSIAVALCLIIAAGSCFRGCFVAGTSANATATRRMRAPRHDVGDARRLQSRFKTAGSSQALKIVVVSLQIVSQFNDVAIATYPDIWESFLDKCQVLNLNLGWILSAGCLIDTDFYDRLLVSTIGPLLLLILVLASYFAAKHRVSVGDRAERARVKRAHASIIFWASLLIYANVSATTFQTFACDVVQTGDLRGSTRSFLRADHRIDCDSARHSVFRAYAAIMCLVYPLGIPFCYSLVLYRERAALLSSAEGNPGTGGEAAAVITVTDNIDFARVLWRPYRPQAFYFEVVECLRRVMLSGVVVFIFPNTAGQVVMTFLMSLFFFAVLSVLNPYANRWDAWLAGIGHAVVMVSMFVALLMKVDTDGENSFSQDVFACVLVATTCGMLVAVAVEACGMCRAALAER